MIDPTFTPREVDVIERLVEGKSSKRIAAELGIAPGAVRVHIHNAAGRLPGGGRPSFKITRWYFMICDGSTGALLIRDNGNSKPS